jgi:uncharacterized protein YcfL
MIGNMKKILFIAAALLCVGCGSEKRSEAEATADEVAVDMQEMTQPPVDSLSLGVITATKIRVGERAVVKQPRQSPRAAKRE